jgi:uncharacterized membrane protein
MRKSPNKFRINALPGRALMECGAGGTVTFNRVSDATSKVMLRLEYEPQGFVENIGDAAGFVTRRVKEDSERFKEYIERREMDFAFEDVCSYHSQIQGVRASARI